MFRYSRWLDDLGQFTQETGQETGLGLTEDCVVPMVHPLRQLQSMEVEKAEGSATAALVISARRRGQIAYPQIVAAQREREDPFADCLPATP